MIVVVADAGTAAGEHDDATRRVSFPLDVDAAVRRLDVRFHGLGHGEAGVPRSIHSIAHSG